MIAADVEPEEVEALFEGDDTRLVLVEGQAPGLKPAGKPCLDLQRLMPGMAQSDEIIGVSNQNRGVNRLSGLNAGRFVSDSSGLLHPVQRDVQQHGADHAALRSSLLSRSEPAILDHARLQPLDSEGGLRGLCSVVSSAGRGEPSGMPRPRKYPPELIERGVRLALESGRPIAHVAARSGHPPRDAAKVGAPGRSR